MSVARNVVFAVALAAPVAFPLGPPAEAAEPSVLGTDAFVGLPAAIAEVDGPSVDVWFAVWNADGTPVTGLAAQVTASVGVVDGFTEEGDGLYRAAYRATGTAGATEATLTAKGKHPVSKRPLQAAATVVLAPARPSVKGAASPAALTFGRDPAALLTLVGAGSAGIAARANTGTLEAVAPVAGAPGTWTARYVPPAERAPRLAIVTFGDAADPLSRSSHLVIPLSGAIDFPVKGEPGASVVLELAGQKFGPVVLDAEGKGRVPVVVPPGVPSATKIAVKDGGETRESLDLKIPEARHLALYPLPKSLPAGGARVVPVLAVALKPDGSPDPDAKPTFAATAGQMGATEALGNGIFRAKWTLPAAPGTAKVSVTTGSELQTDGLDVVLTAPGPASVAVTLAPEALVDGAGPLTVVVTAADAAGAAFDVGEPVLDLDGARAASAPTHEGGAWTWKAESAAQGPVRATAHWKVEASRNPAAELGVVPARARVASDGKATVELVVHAVDAWGSPVPGRKVTLSAEGGTVVPAEVTTGDDGTATATYTAGTDARYVAVRAKSQDLDTLAVLAQFPDARVAVAPPPIPSSRLAAITPTAVRLRSGAAVAAVPAPVASPVSTVSLAVEGVASPGATVTLVASAVDASGNKLPGHVPTLTASGGTLSVPTVGADGTVTATLVIPADAQAAIDVVASAGDRSAKVAVGGDDAASAWGPAPATPAPATLTPAPVEPAVAASPRESSDARWLRVRANGVFGTYRYTQSPSTDPGPVLPATLAVGGAGGGAPATPAGAEGDVRLWLDPAGVPYVGFHGGIRVASYSISSSAFEGTATDALVQGSADLLGRIPFSLGGDQYWVGGKAGFQYGDFLAFLGDLTPGSQIEFLGLSVPGMEFGPELGAEIGPVHVVAGYALGLARGTEPYSNGFDLEAGWEPIDHLYVSGGFSAVARRAVLTGGDTGLDRGTLDDTNLAFKLGLGVAL